MLTAGIDVLEALEWSLPGVIVDCLLGSINKKTFGFGLTGFTISMFVQINYCINMNVSCTLKKRVFVPSVGDIISKRAYLFIKINPYGAWTALPRFPVACLISCVNAEVFS